MLQMAYFERDHRPVTMDVGPVLDLEDVLGSKVCALASRVEPRDYVDRGRAGALQPAQLIGFARRLDPGLTIRISRKRASGWTGCQTGYSPDTDWAHRMLQGYGSGSLTGPGPNPGNLH